MNVERDSAALRARGRSFQHIGTQAENLWDFTAAALPMPRNVTVEAVNNLYVLKWMWDQWETNYTVRFTEHYTMACNRTAEWQCDLTPQKLNYWASYTLRVRAEGPGQNSEWQRLLFRPHMQGKSRPRTQCATSSWLSQDFEDPVY
uniref:Fibronectin type-III domain-containing protein n=1 Tax=Scleropages formosus TaxID=113540 RepID=A0A8C9SX59_SCLFO